MVFPRRPRRRTSRNADSQKVTPRSLQKFQEAARSAIAFGLVSLASGLRTTFSAGSTSYLVQNDPSASPWLYDQRAVSLAVS
jgi:hypothetical protein